MIHEVKDRLIAKLDKLSEERLQELLDFTEFLLFKENRENLKGKPKLDPDKDPILSYIGSVSHGSLAQDIDGELYGG